MISRSTQSFFDPLLTSDGQPYHRLKYKQIISEQVTIGYLSKGGVSYSDTDNMTPYERKIAYETLKGIYDEQYAAQMKAIEEASLRKSSNSVPRSGLTK